MLVLGLEPILGFFNASFILSQLGATAKLQYSKPTFSLTVVSPNFSAALRIQPPFFYYYTLFDSFIYKWKISLKLLCKHLSHGLPCPAMIFAVLDKIPPQALLTFRESSIGTFGRRLFSREMTLSHQEDEDAGDIDYATFVSIDSEDLQRIAFELRFIHSVLVTLTNSQVKFSDAFEEITLTKVDEQCIIGGIEVGKEILFLITLRPLKFFRDLTTLSKRIWLYKTTKALVVMNAPFDLNARFEIYFPQPTSAPQII